MRASVELTERALVRAIMKAQRMGYRIVCGAFETGGHVGERSGVCAMGAANLARARLRLPENDAAMGAAYDAIEAGFDGVLDAQANQNGERRYPLKWLRLGRRLRDRFQPEEVA